MSTPRRNKGFNPDWPPNKKLTIGPKFASVVDDQMPMSKWLLQNFNNFQEWGHGLTNLFPHWVVGINGLTLH